MPYQYLDHQADLGIRGIGATIEHALSQGACAMLAAMANTDEIRPLHTWTQRCTAPDIPSLFVEWLNELLYQRQMNDALFASARVTRLIQGKTEWVLEGEAWGEPLDMDRHEMYTEIKAATYAGLDYHFQAGQHVIQCIVDL